MIDPAKAGQFPDSPKLAQIAFFAGEPANDCPSCKPGHGSRPHPNSPGYVHACFEEKWKLATWQKADPTAITWRPARCYSWRHDGPCALGKAAEDYARIKEALAKHERGAVTYGVMTLDPSAWTGAGWESWEGEGSRPRREGAVHDKNAIVAAYKALVDRWRIFAAALKRKVGKFEYVATVECHRSGWPHLNVVFVNDQLAGEVKGESTRLHNWGRKSRGREVARRVFGDMLESAGFGKIAFIECASELEANGTDRLAAYIAKLAGSAGAVWDGEARGLTAPAGDAPAGAVVHSIEGQMVGEIAKLSQAPHIAPNNFRRLRSSKGFLPPKRRDENVTGAMFDENGREMGTDPAAKLLAMAYRADTPAGYEAVGKFAGQFLDKHQKRANDDGETVKQPKSIETIREVFEILERKKSGEIVTWPERVRGPGVLIDPIAGITLNTIEDFAAAIPGMSGPGWGVARKYSIGSRVFDPAAALAPVVRKQAEIPNIYMVAERMRAFRDMEHCPDFEIFHDD